MRVARNQLRPGDVVKTTGGERTIVSVRRNSAGEITTRLSDGTTVAYAADEFDAVNVLRRVKVVPIEFPEAYDNLRDHEHRHVLTEGIERFVSADAAPKDRLLDSLAGDLESCAKFLGSELEQVAERLAALAWGVRAGGTTEVSRTLHQIMQAMGKVVEYGGRFENAVESIHNVKLLDELNRKAEAG